MDLSAMSCHIDTSPRHLAIQSGKPVNRLRTCRPSVA